jgi:outer membrane biosynthesis protein TonB
MTQHQSDRLVQILNQCCELIAAGESIAACLERFPEHAVALAPLLATVTDVRQLRPVPPRVEALRAERRAQFMASALETTQAVKARPDGLWIALVLWWHGVVAGFDGFLRPYGGRQTAPAGLAAALIAVLFFGTLTTGAVTASAGAIPGDALYPLKTVAERARVILARDPQARMAVEQQIASQHLRDILSVLKLLRRVNRMPLAGVIEELGQSEWQVSGLRLLITPETVIRGSPWVGGTVSGFVRAPGDGTLVALELSVEPMPPVALLTPPTPTPTDRPAPTPTPKPPTPRPTLTPVPTREPTETATETRSDPTEPPATATSTRRPTPTRTRTPIPTFTPTVTQLPTATWTPWPTAPRPDPKRRIIGWVRRIENGRWTIDEITTDTDGNTVFIGNPGVGSLVEAELLVRSDGSYLALMIKELGNPTSTPEPYDFSGVVESIGSGQWNIAGKTVKTDGDTQIDDGIQVGDWVQVSAEVRSGGEIWAKAIQKLAAETFQFSGTVESIDGENWTVAGHTFKVTGNTEISGNPGVGDYVDVEVVQLPDGSLEATLVSLVPPTPTDEPPTPTPTDTPPPPTPTDTSLPPTPTDTPPPTLTDTPVPPTATSTAAPPSPTPTDTGEPQPTTDTPAPPSPVPADPPTSEPLPVTVAPQSTPTL